MWLVGVGGIYGHGCKDVYRLPHILISTPLVAVLFLQQHPYFLFIFVNVFLEEEECQYFTWCIK